MGVSLCGTSIDGPSEGGFDATEKTRAELDMLSGLGVRMVNAFDSRMDESRQFVDFSGHGYGDLMGFPSGYSDTAWMLRQEYGDPMDYILEEITTRAKSGDHMPLMLHDWVAYNHAPGREFAFLRRIVDHARKLGYRPVSHFECLEKRSLWRN